MNIKISLLRSMHGGLIRHALDVLEFMIRQLAPDGSFLLLLDIGRGRHPENSLIRMIEGITVRYKRLACPGRSNMYVVKLTNFTLPCRILIHHRSIGRVALSTIASIILSHHHDVLILFSEVAEEERRLAVEVRSGLERSQGMALSDLRIFAEQFDTRRNNCMPYSKAGQSYDDSQGDRQTESPWECLKTSRVPLMTFAEKGTISVPGSDMVT